MATKKANVRRIGFGDDSIKGGLKDRPEKYAAKRGRTDIVRVLTDPVDFFGSNVQFKNQDKGFFALSLADPDDIMAGDTKKCAAACPLFKRGYRVDRKFAVLLWWQASKDAKGRETRVEKPIVWAFGKDKYEQLHHIWRELPSRDGKKMTMRQIELAISCTDEGFQRLTITPKIEGQIGTLRAAREAVADLFNPPGDLNGECELIAEFVEPEDKLRLEQSLDRAEGKGRFVDDDLGDPDAPAADDDGGDESEPVTPRRAKPGRGDGRASSKPRADAAPDDGDDGLDEDLSAALEDIEADDAGDADNEQEPEEPKPAPRGRSGGTGGKFDSRRRAARNDDPNADE